MSANDVEYDMDVYRMKTKMLYEPSYYGQKFRDFSVRSGSYEMSVKLFNREVIPRWKEKFGGASVTG